MFKFRIYFSGLCMFEPVDNHLEVFLPNDPTATAADLECDMDKPCRSSNSTTPVSHTAILQFENPSDESGSGAKISGIDDVRLFTDRKEKEKGLWVLRFETLSLHSPEGFAENGLVSESKSIQKMTPDNRTEASSLNWLWPIQGDAGKPPVFKPNILQRDASTVADKHLKAAVVLEHGTLNSACLINKGRNYILWAENDAEKKAMTAVLQYEARVKGETIEIQSESFDGKRKSTLQLTSEQGKDIEVWVMNRNYCMVRKECRITTPKNMKISPDNLKPASAPFNEYEYYYNLLDNAPSKVSQFFPRPVETISSPLLSEHRLHCEDKSMQQIYFGKLGTLNTPPSITRCSPSGRVKK